MNKRVIFILALITLFFASCYITVKIGGGRPRISTNEVGQVERQENKQSNDVSVSANANEAKITPNTKVIIQKYYKDCGHTKTDEDGLNARMINLTEEELKKEYPNYQVDKFSKDEVILKRELNSFCGEHYLFIEEEGTIAIYALDENNNKKLLEKTDIAYEYLPETDKLILKDGIYVYGKEELNKMKEDFE